MKNKKSEKLVLILLMVTVSLGMDPALSHGQDASVEALARLQMGQVLDKVEIREELLRKAGRSINKSVLEEVDKNVKAYMILEELGQPGQAEFFGGKDILKEKLVSEERLSEPAAKVNEKKGFMKILSIFGKKSRPNAKKRRTADQALSIPQRLDNFLVSRLAGNNQDDLAAGHSWTLIPSEISLSELAVRLDVKMSKLKGFMENVQEAKDEHGKVLDLRYLAPLWNWQAAPYLHAHKKDFMKGLSKDFIEYIADKKIKDQKKILMTMRDWIKTTKIQDDIEEYLRPKAREAVGEVEPHHFMPSQGSIVDVNKIDVGIEYSGRFPTNTSYNFTRRKMADGRKHWMETRIGMSPQERELVIKKVAQGLSRNLGNDPGIEVRKVENEGGHGHGMSVAYYFHDPKGGKWRVEWDGINRSYDANGKIIPGSGRAGHIELVTPKFQPTFSEMKAVEKAFRENDVIPASEAGGGHVNIDLAPFKGNPKAMARFLSVFHEHRGIIALMFQNEGRLKSAQPAKISSKLGHALKDFRGSEEELKSLLYNERYFNTRLGRKTRYQQLDVTSYFQDVIPEKFIHDDFDILSPFVPWRPQFRVDPKVRKMEMRLMDAPKDAHMSALQLKLVRALLNKALNESGPLSGKIQNVDYQAYVKNPKQAFLDLEKMGHELGIGIGEYMNFVAEGIERAKSRQSEDSYNPIEERLKDNPEMEVWEKAVAARNEGSGISYTERKWELGDGTTRTPLLPQVAALIQQNKKLFLNVDSERIKFATKPVACFRRTIPETLSSDNEDNVKAVLRELGKEQR